MSDDPTPTRTSDLEHATTALVRAAFAVVPLAVLWALAFTGVTPFYPTIVVGSVAMLGLASWVRSTGPSDEVTGDVPAEPTESPTTSLTFPVLRLTPKTAWLALVVALVHYLVGAALYVLASRFVPLFAETAITTYDRAGAVPLWVAVLLGGLLSAPLEEVFWRGSVQPALTAVCTARWPAMGERPIVPVVASAVVYALFHAATTQFALVAAALLGGLVWGWLLHRTRSLGAVMIAHTAWTCLMLLAPPGGG